MNNLDKQYTALLQDILDNGVKKDDRTGTGTLSVFGRHIRHKMSDGFPLLTTKKVHFKSVVTELLWFLRGDTNIKYLVDNDCHIWDGDAYQSYCRRYCELDERDKIEYGSSYYNHEINEYEFEYYSKEEFVDYIKTNTKFAKKWGELGPIYGAQWRSWETGDLEAPRYEHWKKDIDQIQNLIRDLKTNPDSRRLMVNAWNVGELDQMVLPPCHYGFQVYTRELSLKERSFIANSNHYEVSLNIRGIGVDEDHTLHKHLDEINIPTRAISLMWNQRSVDTFLGLPFNIASYGLLLEIIAKEVNMVPDELIGNLGDTHLYLNHIEQAKEQIGRELTREERYDLMPSITEHSKENIDIRKKINNFEGNISDASYHEEWLDSFNIPTRTREPYPLPKLAINDEFWNRDADLLSNLPHIQVSDFYVDNYQSHPAIKAPLSN
jgi:thymidylate synthase